ncbi:hypothetical protein B0H65DRAFT_466979 [Neurospora tetraspora]|uniref:Mid2 domain-containing protein n=1 Tax=Neurospora tetraspora TaxID=94610 RepID=A0AAE0JH20_9PEZI|nr:hypothetical protein B0H65DRAFT_466979 [Neurospora tetraspora]
MYYMTKLLLLISLKPVHVSATTPIAFINPPPLRQEDRDDSKNAVYKIGATMTLQWTEDTEVRSSLVLYQVPGDGFEYVAPNHVQITDYLWIVNTAKNLSFSNVFQFAIYSNGSTTPNATSHYFNITSGSSSSSSPNLSAGSLPVTTTSSASPLPSSTGITTKTSSAGADALDSKTSTATTPASTDGALQSQESGNKKLSTPSAVGIGIGVSSALFLAIAAGAFGYWIFKVRPKRNSISHHAVELPPPQTPHMAHTGFCGPTMVMNGNTGNGNGNGNMYQTKDIFGGELQGHNGPGRNGGSSVYEIDSQTGSAFAWDRTRK